MTAAGDGLMLYVSPKGNDAWTGRSAALRSPGGPFATLERARDAVRNLKTKGLPAGGVTVELAAGTYELSRTFALGAEDSGEEGKPVVYRAKAGAEVRIVGGKMLSGLNPVTDAATLAKLEPSARGKVYQADLKAQGVTDYGSPGGGGLEVFFQDKPMHLSRWPKTGFIKITGLVGGNPVDVRGTKGDLNGDFMYEGDRPGRWTGEKDAWVHGYWFWDWAEQRHKVKSIDADKHILSVEPPYHNYGYRVGQWFYGYNLLSELSEPGEFYVDRDTGILYLYPTGPVAGARVEVSVLPTLVTMKDTSHITLRGMIFEAARGTAVSMSGGTKNLVAGCTLRNVGGWGVTVDGGTEHSVVGCDIYETGAGGISMGGGDRATLTPANHLADNNHVHHYARINRVYNPGITVYGVGCKITHNLVDNAPHMGMGFGGNNHVIEYNEIHSVCYESNDAGAIYTGRNWTMRGTVIRYNYLHHINGFQGAGCVGVYLDDQFSGTEIYGNLFYRVTRAAMIGGGRDCTIENNVFVECEPSTHVDARGLGWAAPGRETMENGLKEVPYKGELWAARYPKLVNILDDDPMAPKGNVIARNISIGGRWGDFEAAAKPLVTFTDNLVDADPHFVDAAHLDFRLKPDSPALKLGFKPLPIGKIGVYKSELRASWPVTSTPRDVPAPSKAQARRTGPPTVVKVARATAPPAVEGQNPAKAMVIEQGIRGEKVQPGSLAWIAYTNDRLFVAIDNRIDPSKPLRRGDAWGQDDAVEIAMQDLTAGKDAPIIVLRGFPSGSFQSSGEAGAPDAVVERAKQGVRYRARVIDAGRWTTEWQIPWASLGVDPAKHTRFALNLSVRKTADDSWVMWRGTGGCTWEVGNAGIIELAQ
jgi:hypothetical protein